jgi:hypothetical protein
MYSQFNHQFDCQFNRWFNHQFNRHTGRMVKNRILPIFDDFCRFLADSRSIQESDKYNLPIFQIAKIGKLSLPIFQSANYLYRFFNRQIMFTDS